MQGYPTYKIKIPTLLLIIGLSLIVLHPNAERILQQHRLPTVFTVEGVETPAFSAFPQKSVAFGQSCHIAVSVPTDQNLLLPDHLLSG